MPELKAFNFRNISCTMRKWLLSRRAGSFCWPMQDFGTAAFDRLTGLLSTCFRWKGLVRTQEAQTRDHGIF